MSNNVDYRLLAIQGLEMLLRIGSVKLENGPPAQGKLVSFFPHDKSVEGLYAIGPTTGQAIQNILLDPVVKRLRVAEQNQRHSEVTTTHADGPEGPEAA